MRKKFFFKRAVILTLVVFSLIVFGAVYFVFQSSMKMDAQHIRVISLSAKIEAEILETRILIDDLILRSDSTALDDLRRSLDTIKTGLESLNIVFTDEFRKFNNNDLKDFSTEYKELSARLLALEEYIIIDNNFRLNVSNAFLIGVFSDFNMSYRQFELFLHRYLFDNTIRYKREIFGVMTFIFLVVLLAGYLIIRLIDQLIIADRTLIQKTIEVENRERQRIASDLHDSLGALLSSMVMHIQVLEKDYEKNPALIKNLKYLNQLANHSLESIEEVINNLNPSLLSRFGLVETLKKIIKKVNVPGKTHFSIDARDLNYKLSPGTEVILYRICTELINNALKHSGAEKAWFTLFNVKKEIHLKYKDNGIGFQDENSFLEDDKTGLNNLFSRIESVGGVCNINSEVDQGVTIEISFDLN